MVISQGYNGIWLFCETLVQFIIFKGAFAISRNLILTKDFFCSIVRHSLGRVALIKL